MKNIKEIFNKIKQKNAATSVEASSARPSSKNSPHTKTILIMLPILILLIAALIAIGITNAANSTTEPQTDQTFTEDGDGYYIWVRAVDHAGNKGPWSEAQRVWIDNKGPSAPVIQGGSSSYALSRTISVTTEANDSGASGISYYEYYKKSGADKPAASVAGTKVTTSATSQTFNTNIAGDYVFFRAVDVVGNKGAWSDGQQVYIDVNKPTITVKQASLTITQGQNYAFSNYFTVAANGTNTNITTTYKVGSTAYTNTSTLAVGTHTVTCTATKTGGNSESATMTVVVNSAGPALVTTATSIQSKTTEFKDAKGNKIVVPGGFKVVTSLATTVDKGIVIQDSSGNQFVWIPIGTITKADGTKVTIEFGRYSSFTTTATPRQYASNYTATVTISSYYQELSTYRAANFTSSSKGNATAKKLATFISNAQTNKGYYLARYEASFGSGSKISSVSTGKAGITNQKPAFKQSTSASSSSNMGTVTSTSGMLWNYIRQGDASLACQNLYAGNEYNGQSFVESDLVNSYAWDTAIMFIQKCSSKTNYANQTPTSTSLQNTGKTSDIVCNIYDMAGNLGEWSTEFSTESDEDHSCPCVSRGGRFSKTTTVTATRGTSYSQDNESALIGFRAVLY